MSDNKRGAVWFQGSRHAMTLNSADRWVCAFCGQQFPAMPDDLIECPGPTKDAEIERLRSVVQSLWGWIHELDPKPGSDIADYLFADDQEVGRRALEDSDE